MRKITLVIPIHDRIKVTQKGINNVCSAITYYLKQTNEQRLQISVIVIDDGSIDGSSEWIKSNHENIIILKGDGNLWWSGSMNKGCLYALENLKSEYIILWNDDTICENDYFINLESILKEYGKGILTSKILWLNSNKLFNLGCKFNRITGKKTIIGLNQVDSAEFCTPIKVDWSGGMGTIIPSYIFNTIGLFDEVNFPQYHGDIDFYLRAQDKGFEIWAHPDLKVYSDPNTTGYKLGRGLKQLRTNLTSIKSNYCLKKDIIFYRKHIDSPLGYFALVRKYFVYLYQYTKAQF